MSKNSPSYRPSTFESLKEGEYFVCRTPHEHSDFEKSYWDTVVDPDGTVRNRLEERLEFLETVKTELKIIKNRPCGRILDVGCGPGFLLSGVDNAWKRYGVEISKFAAENARQWGSIFHGELKDADFADAYFDVVVLHHVIEHVMDPAKLILEVRRILKNDGLLILGTPDFDSVCARRFGENYRLLSDSTHISLFSLESTQRFLRDHGFVIDMLDFPFFDTPYFAEENLLRLFDTSYTSPPFVGNFMTFYCRKMGSKEAHDLVAHLTKTFGELFDKDEVSD